MSRQPVGVLSPLHRELQPHNTRKLPWQTDCLAEGKTMEEVTQLLPNTSGASNHLQSSGKTEVEM